MGSTIKLLLWLAAVSWPLACSGAPHRLTIFDLKLGMSTGDLPAGEFHAYACGSDGGPPLLKLTGWSEFNKCPAEADGLHEVYFEYDDSAEKRARAAMDIPAGWSLGTAYQYFPIVASALFDDTGTLQGLRIVTDPRPEQRKDPFFHFRPRSEHYLLQLYLLDTFGMSAAECRDVPLAPGQSPVMGMITNQRCDRTDLNTGRRYHVEAHFYRRRGERDVDASTGRLTEGQFLSETRAEIRSIAE
jgi:hypothetical protein